MTDLTDPVTFNVVPLHEPTLDGASPEAIIAFQAKMDAFRENLTAFTNALDAHQDLIAAMQVAHSRAEQPDAALVTQLHEARQTLLDIEQAMQGYSVKGSVGETQSAFAAVAHVCRLSWPEHNLRPDANA